MMELPRSTYYYRAHSLEDKLKQDAELRDKIESIVLEFPGYGYRRVTKALHRQGLRVNHKRVLLIMRQEGILCRRKRSFLCTTDSNHGFKVYPNLTHHFEVSDLNQLWFADITYIRLNHEFLYLAALLDGYSRKVIGWSLGNSLNIDLTITALKAAINSRRPPAGCIHHSDRGVQYASEKYVRLLEEAKFQISMSLKGNPYDNATIESFFKTLKCEEVYLCEYRNIKEASESIHHFLEEIYNRKRLHSALGYIPPVEFEDMTLNSGSVLTSSPPLSS